MQQINLRKFTTNFKEIIGLDQNGYKLTFQNRINSNVYNH